MSVGILRRLFFAALFIVGVGTSSWQSWALTPETSKELCARGLAKSAYLDSYERMIQIGNTESPLIPNFGKKQVAQIRTSGIKHLNEIYLGPEFTEDFLEFLEIRLMHYKKVEGGVSAKLTEGIYKQSYLETYLTVAEFKEQIFAPLLEDARNWYSLILSKYEHLLPQRRMTKDQWDAYILSNIGVGFGPNETLATVSYNLEKYNSERGRNLSLEDWRRELLRLRNGGDGEPGLTGAIAGSDLVWRDVLYMTRKMDRDDVPEQEILEWLEDQVEGSGADSVYPAQAMAHAILEYLYLLDVAERIPGFKGIEEEIDPSDVMSIPEEVLERTHWNFYRNASILKASAHARYVFAFDGIGFGTFTIRDADAWASRGAHLDQLETAFAPSNYLIHNSRSKVVALVTQDLPDDLKEWVNKYVSGDEGHGFLPQLTPGQVTLINAAISSFNRNHVDQMTYEFNGQEVPAEYRLSPLVRIAVPGDLSSIKEAIREARGHIK